MPRIAFGLIDSVMGYHTLQNVSVRGRGIVRVLNDRNVVLAVDTVDRDAGLIEFVWKIDKASDESTLTANGVAFVHKQRLPSLTAWIEYEPTQTVTTHTWKFVDR